MFAPRLGNPARCVLRRGRERGCPAPLAARRWFCLASGPRDPRNAVVKIFNTRQRPGWTVPWQDQPVESSSGSGALIRVRLGPSGEERHAILTAAHVVADTRYLQVQRSTDRFSGEKFRARLWAVCHQADLALLVVEDQSAVEGMTALELASAEELPRVFDKVRVVGYPVGGDACSVTEGVVSRVEVQEYSHSLRAGLALTVDAAINSGNSGGPLVDAASGLVVGVAIQKLVARGVELQGHAVPAPLVLRFLLDASEAFTATPATLALPTALPLHPRLMRLPSLGCDLQNLEAPALRRSIGLPDERSGVLVARMRTAAPSVLQVGDVLMAFDGHALDNLGFCQVFGQRLHFAAARDVRSVGQQVSLVVWRQGREQTLRHTLSPAQHLVPRGQHDVRPPFFIYGGLVFQPLSHEFMQGWGSGGVPSHFADLYVKGAPSAERSEVVVLTQILADEINRGHGGGFVGGPVIKEVNGTQIRDLDHLVSLVREALTAFDSGLEPSGGAFLRFEGEGAQAPYRAVLPLEGLRAANDRIARRYGAPPCSTHFSETVDASAPGAAVRSKL
eukprot:TRINITY_DN19862_c0_g1_i2.p1 TRINITY_DN19862_c0_g1~~TRINITY_DN19862_c0_g1_i2.p1  ORF type:complete len:573 (-),score=97.88 TRINITY_DN19862_c0_g1_i2:56-1741(-)